MIDFSDGYLENIIAHVLVFLNHGLLTFVQLENRINFEGSNYIRTLDGGIGHLFSGEQFSLDTSRGFCNETFWYILPENENRNILYQIQKSYKNIEV